LPPFDAGISRRCMVPDTPPMPAITSARLLLRFVHGPACARMPTKTLFRDD
jgi:hypothetical protein